MSLTQLADLIFPDIQKTPEDYINAYAKRNLPEGARVTRYAPSPTGFQHIGGVFAALVAERTAVQSGGVFYLRIEDTDQKREVEGAISDTIRTMNKYGMNFTEGMTGDDTSIGEYGPYKQSERADIYKAFAKALIQKGLAYPCFATPEELEALREKQTAEKVTPGYYGEYAKYRNLSPEEAMAKINAGEKYIIRLKSPGNPETRVEFHDLIKGDTSFPENNQDIVIIKGDGLPTYHFAHAIDDALMGTTHVTRGEEWLSSLPIHVQLFEVLGFKRPEYGHIPTIMKMDGDSRRKLSKRKDAESAVSYYDEEGYPTVCVIEYLLNIINSTYEEWRTENPMDDYHDFQVSLDKMSKSGALFDIVKLNDVSKDVIARMPGEKVYDLYTEWAKEHDVQMYELITANAEMSKAIFSIDREGLKPRKDFAKWMEVKEKIAYFFDHFFYGETAEQVELPKGMTIETAKEIIAAYKDAYKHNEESQETWFETLKNFAVELGYCANRKEYKANPEAYKGMISDVAGAVRAAVTHRSNTPDLYTIMQILGEEKVQERFEKFENL
ncbi:glutamate--tRNA ligase [Niameybacter sp.]|uniref:glutamate--tRNA ligase n=1 Tax=Niameybacter sp. TaxID=2033640 RepID=UPI002FC9BF7C